MKLESFNKAQHLYDNIHVAACAIKNIKWYEQKHYKSGVPLVLKVPYIVGKYAVDSDIVISDKELIKEVLNCIKIYSVKVIQDAEKELENL